MDACTRCKKFADAYQLAILPERFLGENPKAVGAHTIFVCSRVQRVGDPKTNWTGHTAAGDVVLLQRLGVQPKTLNFDSFRPKPMRDVLREGLFFMDEETEDDLCQNSHWHGAYANQTLAC